MSDLARVAFYLSALIFPWWVFGLVVNIVEGE